MVLHDINLSSRYADHIFALRKGKLVAEGAPSEVITSELVKDIFGMDSTVIQDPVSGTPLIVPIGRHHVTPVKPEISAESVHASDPALTY
ncbi:putative siderophore transport system ATP-binding protein YusV [compost metagenome]